MMNAGSTPGVLLSDSDSKIFLKYRLDARFAPGRFAATQLLCPSGCWPQSGGHKHHASRDVRVTTIHSYLCCVHPCRRRTVNKTTSVDHFDYSEVAELPSLIPWDDIVYIIILKRLRLNL